jgi:hypothetical protein
MAITLDGSNLTTSGVINSGTAVTASGTSVDFTIPTGAKRITVMFSGVSTNGTAGLLAQLGDSGGIETTGYTGMRGSTDTASAASASSFTAGLGFANFSQAADTINGNIVFTNISGNTWTGSGVVARNSATTGALISSATTKTLSDTLTQLRITATNGTDTFDAGTINILYE